MKILVIGSGAREHALVKAFKGHTVYCSPGNWGISQDAKLIQGDLLGFAQKEGIDLTVVGPEAPLSEGVVDLFLEAGQVIFGPCKDAAKLESSKAYSKTFMQRYGIPTARSSICKSVDEARLALPNGPVVLKASGLCAGKGVYVLDSRDEAILALDEIKGRFGGAADEILVEERLEGVEVSIHALCDGHQMQILSPSQDHKRLLDGDLGPNTGGMGAYTPYPLSIDDLQLIEDKVINPTLEGIKNEGFDYRGVLYFGIIMTENGPKVLEYNCRFGDPETQVILPLIQGDLAELLLSCAQGKMKPFKLSSGSCCCVVLASKGYPHECEVGKEIHGLSLVEGVTIYHAGTKEGKTSGGRVLTVAAQKDNLEASIRAAYQAVKTIHFDGMQYRKDIATAPQTLSLFF